MACASGVMGAGDVAVAQTAVVVGRAGQAIELDLDDGVIVGTGDWGLGAGGRHTRNIVIRRAWTIPEPAVP